MTIKKNNIVEELTYKILPARPSTRVNNIELQNHLYQYWKNIWTGVFAKTGMADALSPDEFFRQDIITCIQHGEEIVGMHLYTFFNMFRDASMEHSYISAVDPETLQILQKTEQLMSMEYLTVNPKWRKSELGIPWGEIIIALGLRLLPYTPCKTAIGTSRTDVKVDRMAEKSGFITLDKTITKYGYECSIVLCDRDRVKDHPDATVQGYLDQLWNNRIDYSGLTPEQTDKLRRVA